MYKRAIFIFAFFCGSVFGLSFCAGFAGNDEDFSSPITVPLYTNTVVETADSNDKNNNDKPENQNNKLRPRYNVAPNLGNRIELVSAQTAKSLPEPQQIKNAEFNVLQNSTQPESNTSADFASSELTVPAPLVRIDSSNVAGNLGQNFNGNVSPINLSELSVAQNMPAQNNQAEEVLPIDIPEMPDCSGGYSYNKFVDKYTGYFFGSENRNNRRYNNDGFFCEGWVEGGIFLNTDSPDNKINPIIQYNDQDSEFVMNQLYISFGRKLTRRGNWFEFGGQVDLLFGTDYFYTSAVGFETRRSYYLADVNTIYPEEAVAHWNASHGKRRDNTAALYGLSIPQVYGEIQLPVIWNTTVKAGHFYANAGIESAAATQNFFYSHSYNFMFGQPTTLTGAIFTTEIPSNHRLSNHRQLLIYGITQGWDMFDKQGGLNYIIGTKSVSRRNERNYVALIAQIGRQSDSNSHNRTSYTLTINRQLSERLTDSWEHTFGYEEDGAVKYLSNTSDYCKSCWVSLAKYLKYEITSNLSVGIRAEWFRDEGLARVQKAPIDSILFYYTGKNYYELTLGANWQPTSNITIRPELRFDWSDVKMYSHFPAVLSPKPGSYNGNSNMTSFAVD
ncbi:MAG: porin, partial [Planctomycetaceae bacterium]|nr:porin [Planctomycetaceae bacterium]